LHESILKVSCLIFVKVQADAHPRLFNFSRIPLPGTDAFSTIAPNATHATVIIDDFIYSIEVFEKPPSVDDVPAPLPLVVIEANIQAAVKDARKRLEAGEKAKAVGVLTADHRDTWARNREYLLSVSSENRAALESISTSLLALCLDPYTLPSLPTEDPLVNPTVDAQLRNGVGGIDGGRNRWYDKGVSIAVETNGRTSFSGEHSPIDALIPAITIEYVNGTPIDLAAFEGKSGGNGAFSRIDFVVDEQLEQEIKACAKRNQTILDDSDASQLWFGEYGVDWIKKHGKSGAKKEVDLKVDGFLAKISPDAYIQQALQLAWYKDQGYASATYETASTRAMKHGRTDVIRTLSVESRSFVKSMLDANSTVSRACSGDLVRGADRTGRTLLGTRPWLRLVKSTRSSLAGAPLVTGGTGI
jgi:carnitine O-acetyltransferase